MLVTLVAVVLGLHLILLAGGITLQFPGASLAHENASTDTTASATSAGPTATSAAAAPQLQPVHVSTVRWIVPAPAPAPRAEPAPRPKPVRKAEPVARPAPAPEPVVVAQALPEPTEPPASTPAETSDTASQEVAVSEAPSPEPAAAPEPLVALPTPAETPQASEPADADESLLVAAAGAKRPARAAVTLPPATPPPSTRLHYDVTGNVKGIGYKAQGTLDWTVADGRYEARMEMRVLLLGSRSQTSTGRIGPNGLMPERFADKSRSEKATHFDAAQQRIRFSSNAPEVPLLPGAQDRLSLFLQLASLLQARPQAYATGQTVDMQVAGTGDAPIWRFDVGEESTISLPAGEFKVRHLVRQPRKEFDSTVEMWLSPSLNHLPVRLRVTQSNGDVADQQLSQRP